MKDTQKDTKESAGKFDDPSKSPVTTEKNARLRGGHRNMSITKTVPTQRTAFPLIAEIDSIGLNSVELGLSPAWQATFQNYRANNALTPMEVFAEYVADPTDQTKMLHRNGLQRPFSDQALGAKTFHVDHAGGGLAATFIPEDALLPQEMFMDEISSEVGLHVAWLFHCVDVSDIYHAQLSQGPVGLSSNHDRPNSILPRTPYEEYYNLCLTKFNVDELNIPLNQRHVYTLKDLAARSLQLLAPISHGAGTSGAWTMSQDLFVTSRGFAQGFSRQPWGEIMDADGNLRYLVQPPSTVAVENSLVLFANLESANGAMGGRYSDCYTHVSGAVNYTDAQMGVNAEVSIAGITLDILEGSAALKDALVANTFSSGSHDFFMVPMNGEHAAPNFVSNAYAIGDAASFQTDEHVRRLWDQPTSKVLSFIRAASRMLSPQFRSLGIAQASQFATPARLQAGIPWSLIVDLENVFSTFKIRFNPARSGAFIGNNGPFGITDAQRENLWMAANGDWDFQSITDTMEGVFGNLTAPTGVGIETAYIRNILGCLPPAMFEAFFTPDGSSLEKRQRTVILPAGRTSTSMSVTSSASDANMDAHTTLIRRMLFGTWRTKTLMPLSDVDYTGIYDLDVSVGVLTLPVGHLHAAGPMFTTDQTKALTANIDIIATDANEEMVERVDVPIRLGATAADTVTLANVNYTKLVHNEDVNVGAFSPMAEHIKFVGASVFENVSTGTTPAFGNYWDPTGSYHAMAAQTSPLSTGVALVRTDTLDNAGTAQPFNVQNANNFLNYNGLVRRTGVSTIIAQLIWTPGATLISGPKGVKYSFAEFHAASVLAGTNSATPVTPLVPAAFANQNALDNAMDADYANTVDGMTITIRSYVNTPVGGAPVTGTLFEVAFSLGIEGADVRNYTAYGGATRRWINRETGGIYAGSTTLPDVALPQSEIVGFQGLISNVVPGNAGPAHKVTRLRPLGPVADTESSINKGANGNYVLPELLNVMLRLDLQLIDAAIANYSNMRLYPRAIQTSGFFAGLPYHGVPQAFMRGLVEELQPSLVQIDHVTGNPLASSNLNLLRVNTETYEQTGYQTALLDFSIRAGNVHSSADASAIRAAQDSLVKRGMIN